MSIAGDPRYKARSTCTFPNGAISVSREGVSEPASPSLEALADLVALVDQVLCLIRGPGILPNFSHCASISRKTSGFSPSMKPINSECVCPVPQKSYSKKEILDGEFLLPSLPGFLPLPPSFHSQPLACPPYPFLLLALHNIASQLF